MEFFGIFTIPTSIIFPSLKINVPFLIVFSELITIVVNKGFIWFIYNFDARVCGKYSFCDNTKRYKYNIAVKNLLKAPIVFVLKCLFFNKYKLLCKLTIFYY